MYKVVAIVEKRRIIMQEKVIVAVDAMGGDNAPAEIIKGVIDAVSQSESIVVKLVGQENVISEELKKYTYRDGAVQIVNASEVIETGEPPVMAIRRKKDSSIVVALNLVKKGEADAFVSAGSSGDLFFKQTIFLLSYQRSFAPDLSRFCPFDQTEIFLNKT